MNKSYNFKFIRGKDLEYATFKKNTCRRCTNKECSRDTKAISKCLNKGNFASKTQRYISTYKQEEQREKTYIKLTELLNEYFGIGTDSCIAYNLLREGNITTNDFVQFNEEIIDDIAHFLINKGVHIGER